MSGSSSSTNSKQTTTNTSLSQGIQGDNSGVVLAGDGNTIQMTDFGAIDAALDYTKLLSNEALNVANNSLAANAELVDSSLAYGNELTINSMETNAELVDSSLAYGNELALNSMDNSAQLSVYSMDSASSMLSDSLIANNEALDMSAGVLVDAADIVNDGFGGVADLMAGQLDTNSNTMLAVHENSLKTVNSGNELALALTETSQSAMTEQSNNTFDSLNNGFKSMMQFAENATRSDGAMVAQSSNKVLMVGLVAAAVAVAVKGLNK